MINLQQMTILVTRPNPAGNELCRLIDAHGGKAIHLPTIEIVPIIHPQLIENIKQIDQLDWLIFISPQAVYIGGQAIKKIWPTLPQHIKIAAVGAGTAQALKEMGYNVHVYPEMEAGSEGLLAVTEFSHIANKKIMIVRGQEGRELLAHSLEGRGAIVKHLITYERRKANININPYLDLLKTQQIDAIIGASVTAIQYLKELCGEIGWEYIKVIPLVVLSERIKTLAHNLGFQTIWITRNSSHIAFIEAIQKKGK